jgi:SAM-dependent methyltransferase
LRLGRTLDVGCGIGRNLQNLGGGSIGVDHNPTSVAAARARGLEAFTVDEFLKGPFAVPASFDSLLVAHVLEHLSPEMAREMVQSYLPYVRKDGTVVLITPQKAGQASDPTHVTYFDLPALESLAAAVGLRRVRSFSFPFPAAVGLVFPYNENVFVGACGSTRS